ncbi:NAD-dependent epimerase/dehydratase family protein [Furfurilactobacillus entadae]|uniref:NAD-dependent epimerase/dehydratase family protein n=1 Tax=Furfurilactobacillus entadae TaxID=2922307 RepID=UPI0035EDA955
MSKVLITGGAGFIGSNLAHRLVENGDDVVIVDDLSMGLRSNLADLSNITFYEHSITDEAFMAELLINEKFDYIFLLAAVASVADSVERPFQTHEINQEADIFILETIRKNHLAPEKVLFSSSAAVYGNDPELPKQENSPIRPMTPYAIDKFSAERFMISYAKLYSINAVAVRFFNVYGPKQNPNSPYSGVLSILTSAMKENKTFSIFGDGEQSRDFVYIDDVVDALNLLTFESDVRGDVYNIATGSETSLKNVIKTMEDVTGLTIDVQKMPERAGDVKHSVANIDKICKLGFVPKVVISEGLNKYWKSL